MPVRSVVRPYVTHWFPLKYVKEYTDDKHKERGNTKMTNIKIEELPR
jgi:hypothetical protein